MRFTQASELVHWCGFMVRYTGLRIGLAWCALVVAIWRQGISSCAGVRIADHGKWKIGTHISIVAFCALRGIPGSACPQPKPKFH